MSTPEQRAAITEAATNWYFARENVDPDVEWGGKDMLEAFDNLKHASEALAKAIEAILPEMPQHAGICNCARCDAAYGPRKITITCHHGQPYPKGSVGASESRCWDCNAPLTLHETIDKLTTS